MRAKAAWGALSGGPAALRSRVEPSRHGSTLPEGHIPETKRSGREALGPHMGPQKKQLDSCFFRGPSRA